ncbi:hypothetical protein ACOSQ2_017608 [Xanthoceras sorbifolium]
MKAQMILLLGGKDCVSQFNTAAWFLWNSKNRMIHGVEQCLDECLWWRASVLLAEAHQAMTFDPGVAFGGALFVVGSAGAGGAGAVEASAAESSVSGGVVSSAAFVASGVNGTLRAAGAVCGVVGELCFGSSFDSIGSNFITGAGSFRGVGVCPEDVSDAVDDLSVVVNVSSAVLGASSSSAAVSSASSTAAAGVVFVGGVDFATGRASLCAAAGVCFLVGVQALLLERRLVLRMLLLWVLVKFLEESLVLWLVV